MKVLVVDDDIDFRELAQVFIHRSYPLAEVSGYDPRQHGLPAADFPWADYDLVLLDYELQSGQTGLDWLRRYSDLPGFPAVIFATGAGDENLAARAMKFGADEYLSKRDVSADRLGQLIDSVLAERTLPVVGNRGRSSSATDPSSASNKSHMEGYQLRRLLGCGGTADVYLALRERDGNTVVLKIMREGMANNSMAIERSLREARLLMSMDSAHVVRVYDYGDYNGRVYMVMEYLGHGDLRTRISEGLDWETAREYACAIAAGLAAIHSKGIVHRDLKPGNIMFRYDESLALTDFGLALHHEVDDAMTKTGMLVGTPVYISPEQCDGVRADARSDQYSLGVILFEMLSGQRPYVGDSASTLFFQHMNAPIPELPSHVRAFQPIVDRLLAKDPDQRYTSASDVVAALRVLSVDE